MISRQMKTCVLSLWVLVLSVTLLCAQGVTLHVHSLGHDQQHTHTSSEAVPGHSHLSEVHLSTDVSHAEYHNEVASELDMSPDVLPKKVSSSVLVLALLIPILALFLSGVYQRLFRRYYDRSVVFPWRYLFSPPLRAPPI